jgi:hypothetical protein
MLLPVHFGADPDPAFLLDADPDPAFHFGADLDPNPAFHSDADPDPASQNDADPDPQHCLEPKTYQVKINLKWKMFQAPQCVYTPRKRGQEVWWVLLRPFIHITLNFILSPQSGNRTQKE